MNNLYVQYSKHGTIKKEHIKHSSECFYRKKQSYITKQKKRSKILLFCFAFFFFLSSFEEEVKVTQV